MNGNPSECHLGVGLSKLKAVYCDCADGYVDACKVIVTQLARYMSFTPNSCTKISGLCV